MVAYTVAGVVASGLVGLTAGWVGSLIPDGDAMRTTLLVAAAVGMLVALREWVGRSWPIPQVRRQTPENLRRRFSAPVAAGLWGFDLGLVFSTWLTFAGPWFVVSVAVALGEPWAGVALLVGHWLARAAWLWLTPYLLTSARIGPTFSGQVIRTMNLFRSVQVLAVLVGVVALITLWIG